MGKVCAMGSPIPSRPVPPRPVPSRPKPHGSLLGRDRAGGVPTLHFNPEAALVSSALSGLEGSGEEPLHFSGSCLQRCSFCTARQEFIYGRDSLHCSVHKEAVNKMLISNHCTAPGGALTAQCCPRCPGLSLSSTSVALLGAAVQALAVSPSTSSGVRAACRAVPDRWGSTMGGGF